RIGMVYQHFTLVPSMSVAENFALARADLSLVVDWPTERRRLHEFLKDMPFKVDLEAPVSALAAGQKQKVEILKQLYLASRILILDEPTSVLPAGEAGEILDHLCVDDDKGHQAVVNVSLSVHAGEIVGIAGVSGNGQAEMVEVLAGQREASAGTITVHGEPYRATRMEMRRHKVFCLPEEPL